MYANGEEIGRNDMSQETYSNIVPNTIRIGRPELSNTNRHWDGQLDDVRIYNRELTADEIKQIAAGNG